jgi:DNA-binding NarL/FixJ family response regulator
MRISTDISSIAELGELKVLVVDDHEAIRMALASVCAQNNFKLIAATETVDAALESLGEESADVAVLDLSLADGSAASENVEKLVTAGIPVLIFSIADKPQPIRAALKAGAAALVPKSHSMTELVAAIKMVAAGVIVNNLQTTAAIDADSDFKAANLSPREREVLSLYASGLALKQVAFSLNIKVPTAKEHIDRVRNKYAQLGRPAVNKTELLMRALEDGILEEGSF